MKGLKKNKKGFTLIEMLIVVVIIGILAAVILPKMGSSSRTARVNACKANVTSINTGIELITFEQNIVNTTLDGAFLATGNFAAGTTYIGGMIDGSIMIAKFPQGGVVCPIRGATGTGAGGGTGIYTLVDGRVIYDNDAAAHVKTGDTDHPN